MKPSDRRSRLGHTTPSYAELAANKPAGSSWGVFGDAYGRGTANFAGSEQIVAAASLVERGESFNLDHGLKEFDPPMARARSGPRHEILEPHPQVRDDVLHDLFLQATSQVDGLRHRRASGEGFYDGVPDAEISANSPELGIQLLAEQPIVSRGILLDLEGLHAERGRPLDHAEGPILEVEDLEDACTRQGAAVRPGDIVQVHTGWARWFLDAEPARRLEVRAARRATGFRQTRSLARWIWHHQVAVLATDTFAVEVLPVAPDSDFFDSAPEDAGMMHQELIARLGVILGELWKLDDLAEDSRHTGKWDSLCVVKPLNLLGGVGSPANATALR